MRDLTYGLYGLDRAIARSAMRLLALRPSENAANPYVLVAGALRGLISQRRTDPLAGLAVVSAGDIVTIPEEDADDYQPALAYHPPLNLTDLPDLGDRPPSIVDLYGGSAATYGRAMFRLTAASRMRGTHQPAS